MKQKNKKQSFKPSPAFCKMDKINVQNPEMNYWMSIIFWKKWVCYDM